MSPWMKRVSIVVAMYRAKFIGQVFDLPGHLDVKLLRVNQPLDSHINILVTRGLVEIPLWIGTL